MDKLPRSIYEDYFEYIVAVGFIVFLEYIIFYSFIDFINFRTSKGTIELRQCSRYHSLKLPAWKEFRELSSYLERVQKNSRQWETRWDHLVI